MDKVNEIVKGQEYQLNLKKIDENEIDRKYCRHQWKHFLDVARISYIMFLESQDPGLQELQARPDRKEIVYAAALLHDIGRWVQYKTGQCHAQASAKLAEPLLINGDFNQTDVEIITAAIAEHRKYNDFKTPLGRILAEADNYSRQCYNCFQKQDCKKYKKMSWEIEPVIY